MELEKDFDNQVDKLRDDISRQEEKEKSKIKAEFASKTKKALEDYNKKLLKERETKDYEFQRILKRIEDTEKKKADLEIEQYRNEQKRKLEERIVSVTDFKEEKEKMQSEATARYNALKQEYQQKIEEEKRKIEDEIYKEETKRYELELELAKNEFAKKQSQAGDLESLKKKLEQELKEKLDEIEGDNKYKIAQETLKELEDEKTRKIIEIENSLKDLSLNNEKPELAKRLQDALKEQKDLENKIEKVNDSIEDLKKKKNRDNDKGGKVISIKEQIAKTDEDIKKAELEYQRLLEDSKNRQEYEYIEDSDLNERVDFDDDSGHQNKVGAGYSKPSYQNKPDYGNISLEKLANDISEIKTLIEDSGIGKTKMKDYLLDVEEFRRKEDSRKERSYVEERMYVQREEVVNEKSRILERVRTNLERQIEELNEKVNFIKQKEQVLKGTKRDYDEDAF